VSRGVCAAVAARELTWMLDASSDELSMGLAGKNDVILRV